MITQEKLINSNRYISYLFYLLPAILVTGPFLSNLAVSIIAIYFIFISIKNKLWVYYKNTFTLIFVIFYTYLLFTSILSLYSWQAFESSLFYFRFLFFSLCCFYLIKNNNKFLKNFTFFLLLTILIVALDGLIQYFLGFNVLGYEYNGRRVSGFFNDELVLGSFLSRLFPLVFALIIILDFKIKYKILISISLFILVDVLVFLSGERTAFFYTTLTCIMLIIFMNKFKLIRLVTFVISLILITAISLNYSSVKERMIDNTILQMGLEENKRTYIFSWKHHNIYVNSIKMTQDSPLIGHGPKSYRNICLKGKYNSVHCSTHSHNTYLQLLVETGIIGFFIVFSIFLYLTYVLVKKFFGQFRNIKDTTISDYQVCLIITMFISLWPLAPSMNFFGSWISIIYFLPVGFYLASNNKVIINE